jgi:hypothetical protein
MAASSTSSTILGITEARLGRLRRNHQRRIQRCPTPTSIPSNIRIKVGPSIRRMGRWAPAEAAPKNAAASSPPDNAPSAIDRTGRICGIPAAAYAC